MFPDQRERHKSDGDSAVEMCLDKYPKTQLDFVVISLNEQYFALPVIGSHLCIAVIDNA